MSEEKVVKIEHKLTGDLFENIDQLKLTISKKVKILRFRAHNILKLLSSKFENWLFYDFLRNRQNWIRIFRSRLGSRNRSQQFQSGNPVAKTSYESILTNHIVYLLQF